MKLLQSAPASLVFVLATITVSPAAGQQRNAVSFEANVGWGIGRTNDEYMDNRKGLTADAMLAVRVRSTAGGAVVAGLNANGFASGPYATICLPAADGGCIPAFPSFWALGGLAGWENAKTTFRVMGGAGYATTPEDGAGVALLGRADAGVPIAGPVALVASLRAALVPDIGGDAFQLYSLGFGLRLR